MPKDKAHFINDLDWNKAEIFQKKNRFWNPAMTGYRPPCGSEAYLITKNWKRVTCKRCLQTRRDNAR